MTNELGSDSKDKARRDMMTKLGETGQIRRAEANWLRLRPEGDARGLWTLTRIGRESRTDKQPT
jgi:hypothetical protein